MILSRVLSIEECKVMPFGTLAAGYLAVGDSQEESARMILFQNFTDVIVWITDDPLKDKFPLVPYGSFVLDISTNKQSDEGYVVARGTQWYAKAMAGLPSSGGIYITCFTGSRE
jgi:hypothetical protein